MRPFRFGVEVSGTADRSAWRAFAHEVQDLGYSTLVVVDHLADQLAPMPALMAAADAAPNLRVGSFVLANQLRHPVVLAKEVATVDRLTDGRMELGIGAGWNRDEHERLGIPFPAAEDRIRCLAEALTIVKAMLAGEPATFTGDHYRVQVAGVPEPVQKPRPPILVGGGGRRMLTLAGREADIVGLNPRQAPRGGSVMSSATAAATREKLRWIEDAAGPRFRDLEINIRANRTIVTKDWGSAVAQCATELGLPPADVAASPHLLIGDTQRIADTLQQRREEFGISYYVVQAPAFRDFAPTIARLAGR